MVTHALSVPHNLPTGGHLQKLWGGRPRPQPAPGRPGSILQMLDTSTEQRDEASRADQGSAPLDIRGIPGLGKLCGITLRERATVKTRVAHAPPRSRHTVC